VLEVLYILFLSFLPIMWECQESLVKGRGGLCLIIKCLSPTVFNYYWHLFLLFLLYSLNYVHNRCAYRAGHICHSICVCVFYWEKQSKVWCEYYLKTKSGLNITPVEVIPHLYFLISCKS
jgi:hypothetical protein